MRYFFFLTILINSNFISAQDLRINYKKEKSFFWNEAGILKYKGKTFSGQIFENYKNNNLKYEENYLNGKLEGKHEGFYKNGFKKYSHSHKNGYENGYFEYFHKNGKISQKGITENGKTKEIESFKRNGKACKLCWNFYDFASFSLGGLGGLMLVHSWLSK